RSKFGEAARALLRACASVPRFSATLGQFRFFAHGRNRFTMWLAPEPAAAFAQLQTALQAQFPECNDVSTHGNGFVPHLSLGQAAGRPQLEERLAELRGHWQPFAFEVGSAAIIFREGDLPFEVDRTVPVG